MGREAVEGSGGGAPPSGAEPAEILPDIYRIQLPVPVNRPGYVNAYLIRAENGWMLLDAGWGIPETLDALNGALRALGTAVGEIRLLLMTHIHPDHFGMACRIKQLSGAMLAIHHLEMDYLETRYAAPQRLFTEMPAWFRTNGAPPEMIQSLLRASRSMLEKVGVCYPDRKLSDGDRIPWGRYDFEVIWTPGHTEGHICLYDRGARLLVSGDHLLAAISPNVATLRDGLENILSNYLASLRRIIGLEVETILPGHGLPFSSLAERAGELLAHHEERLAEMLALLPARGGANAHQVAQGARWRRGRAWDELGSVEQRLAVMETIAHLDLLCQRGLARRLRTDGRILYERREDGVGPPLGGLDGGTLPG